MITINLDKAKQTSHDLRRAKRDAEYVPVDGGSMYASLTEEGEAKRQEVKVADDQLQLDIEAAKDEHELKQLLVDGGILDV